MNLKLDNAEKNYKIFFVSEIRASEKVAINCLFSGENTSYRHPMGSQTVRRSSISLRQTF